ncbi:MAG: hypothetical protein R3B89_07955 [Polyangiaceae bacterium]
MLLRYLMFLTGWCSLVRCTLTATRGAGLHRAAHGVLRLERPYEGLSLSSFSALGNYFKKLVD